MNQRPSRKFFCTSIFLLILTILSPAALAKWKPAEGPLMTKWAKDVSPKKVHPEYPRPQLVRKDWANLNGLWQYAITPKDQSAPEQYDGDILVPFPAESALSGVMKPVGHQNRLWYKRSFTVPSKWSDQRILLHFGAVDWNATVFINGAEVGRHKGGYDPFSFDITDALTAPGPQEIVVSVYDPIRNGKQPRGKQVREGHGIWYTSTTGIWQTVWLEPVNSAHIKSLKLIPDIDRKIIRVTALCENTDNTYTVEANAKTDWLTRYGATARPDQPFSISIHKPKLWSPDSPFLYNLNVTLKNAEGKVIDTVASYFAMRKISMYSDNRGANRFLLNNKPIFVLGPLDQGFWPDGLYTTPTDAALKYDIQITKKLGFNAARKHVKVEPDRWYYWCDRLGLLVWQDMPNPDGFIKPTDPDIQRDPESAAQFELELKNVITALQNHPCIVMWVAFNEGWGQYDTARITRLIREWDPTRLVNSASGWADRRTGDIIDIHKYPGPVAPQNEFNRAAVLGEFGGLGLPIARHTWQDEENWGYKSFENKKQLTAAYLDLISKLKPLIANGLAAAIYTQTTDVEIEVNGLMTYDRRVIKMDPKKIARANKTLYLPSPIIKTILPAATPDPNQWRYTTDQPCENWYDPNYDDSSWSKGPAGFGVQKDCYSIVRTQWSTPNIWLRRTFELTATRFTNLNLAIHHDEDAVVYLNGQLLAELPDYSADYAWIPLNKKQRKLLNKGPNLLAIRCTQTEGGQYIDAALLDLIPKYKK